MSYMPILIENAGTSLGTISNLNFTGPVTASKSGNIYNITLANSGVTAGSGYNTFTVDAYGRITTASTTAYLTGNQLITLSGDVIGSGSTAITTTLATVNSNVGTFGTASSVSTFVVNGKGLITSASNTAIAISGSQITSGVVSVANGGTGVSTVAQNLVFAGPTSGTGAPTFRALTISDLPAAVVGGMNYQGTWNATTNIPAINTGSATSSNKGQYYKVSVVGSTTVDTISQWNVGDLIVSDGTTWDKIDGLASEVTTVAGRIGSVILTQSDIGGLTISSSPTFVGATLSGLTTAGYLTNTSSGVVGSVSTIPNTGLTNSTVTIIAGTGLSGGGSVALGGSVTITNSGVTSISGTANQITASAATGSVTLSLPTVGTAVTNSFVKITTDAYGRISATNTVALSDLTSLGVLSNTLSNGNIFVGNSSNVATGVTMSGDASITNTGSVSLATTGVTAGTYGSAIAVSTIVVDAKGRITSASNTPAAAITGDISIPAGGTVSTLATVNSNIGTFGTSSAVSTVVVNAKGLVTSVSNTTITPASIGATPAFTRKTITTSYTILSTDYLIGVSSSSSAITVTLPSGIANMNYVIKDESGNCGTYNITIATTSGQTIDGASSYIMAINYEAIGLYFNGTSWFVC